MCTSASTILSDDDQLDVPAALKDLIPPQHANSNVTKLFQFNEEIGSGVTGSVHAVTYQKQSYVLKRFQRNIKWKEQVFINETLTLCRLNHCGIVQFIAVFMDEDYLYLLMERADFDLRSLITSSGPLDENKVRTITYSLFKAVAYFHAESVVHRDLRPENIVFCKCDPIMPKLIDFGDALVVENKKYNEFGSIYICTCKPHRYFSTPKTER